MSICTQCGNAIVWPSLILNVCWACQEKDRVAAMETLLNATHAALSVPAKPLAVPVALKPQTLDAGIASLIERCKSLTFDDKAHGEDWKNQIAHDLNFILTRVEYCLKEEEGDETDISFAESALRIVERVAEFEQITEVDEQADAQEKAFYAACEPHQSGDDENLTSEELSR